MRKQALALVLLSLLASGRGLASYWADGDMIEGYSTITSSGGTTALLYNSKRNIKVTGSSNHTITLPNATATRVGKPYVISNASTGSVTVQDFGANTLATLLSGEYAQFISTSAASSNGSWLIRRPSTGLGGTASRVATFDSNGALVSDANISTTELQVLDGVTSTLCGIDQSCTLTNKTISGASNTLSNIPAGTALTGQVPKANGGTGLDGSSLTFPNTGTIPAYTPVNHGVVISGASTVASVTSPGTAGQILTSNGASADPTFQDPAEAPSQSYELSNVGLAASVGANALTIALKQGDGSSDCSAGGPCKIGFRNGSSTVGGYTQRSVTGASSITISSGSTLGHASATAEYVYVYAIDNAGSVELAVSTGLHTDQGTLVTTTAEGGAGGADSRSAIYSSEARTNAPIRLIGRVKSTQATAGTWATSPSEVSLWPFQYNSVTSNSSGQERVERASITNSGTPAIASQSGSWLSGVTDNGAGDTSFTMSGFSSTPTCVCGILGSSGRTCSVNAITSTSLRIETTQPGAGNTDLDFHIICMGPR